MAPILNTATGITVLHPLQPDLQKLLDELRTVEADRVQTVLEEAAGTCLQSVYSWEEQVCLYYLLLLLSIGNAWTLL